MSAGIKKNAGTSMQQITVKKQETSDICSKQHRRKNKNWLCCKYKLNCELKQDDKSDEKSWRKKRNENQY